MSNIMDEILTKYKTSNAESYAAILHATDIMKVLLNNSFESYIVGTTVKSIIENKPVNYITILTNAPYAILNNLYSGIIEKDNHIILVEGSFTYEFLSFVANVNEYKNINLHFDQKLAATLTSAFYTCNSLALSPKLSLTDIYEGYVDIKDKVIRTCGKPRRLFKEHPEAIIKAFEVLAESDYTLSRSLKWVLRTSKKLVSDLLDSDICESLRFIASQPNSHKAYAMMTKLHIFKKHPPFHDFVKRMRLNDKMTEFNKNMVMYLMLECIPDKASLPTEVLKDYFDHLRIASLLLNSKATPMMVYHIGEKTLLESDQIARIYKSNYHSQGKAISKMKQRMSIKSARELNITNLEIITMLNGDRSIKVQIIFNMLLEKVLNGEIANKSYILREEAKKINQEIDDVFKTTISSEQSLGISEQDIEALQKKYQKDLNFLIKVYLNDQQELFGLSPRERREVQDEAAEHAKEFLLQTGQYQILESRGLIND